MTLYEVHKRVLQQRDEAAALQATGVMLQGRVVDLTTEIVLLAVRISLEFGLPMADALILATARAHDATLWTQDADFRDVEGVRYRTKKGSPCHPDTLPNPPPAHPSRWPLDGP